MTTTTTKGAERLEALQASLTDAVAELSQSAQWLAYLDTARHFHNYSLRNLLLILAQRPDATRVAGFKAWQKLGRQVRTGERSIGILAPCTRKVTEENTDTGETRDRVRVVGFRVASVFDISQTDGEPIADRPRPELLEGEAPAGLWESLAGIVAANGYTLERGDCNGANGVTVPADKVIRVRGDVSAAQAVKTLAHEVAHMLMHAPAMAPGSVEPVSHRDVAEIEAESVAYLVATSHGMTTTAYSLPYVAGWSDGDADKVAETATRVLETARAILAVTDVAETAETTPAAA